MKLTPKEKIFLTALAREQNQQGCRGLAHDLLRKNAYAHAPLQGRGSLAFSYEAVSLTSLLLKECKNIQEIDDFLRLGNIIADPEWPWSSADEYRTRLEEAKKALAQEKSAVSC